MQKRAELTSSQIATLVLSIAGFIIALVFLLVFLDTESMSAREICRLSILTRATAPEALQRLAPLKCTTQKICLSESGNDKCADAQFIGENKEKIDAIKITSETDLEKAVADSMLDCWRMVGEGKLDVFGGGVDVGIWNTISAADMFEKESVCLICSRLAIAKDIKESTLEKVDVSGYMETTPAPNSELTYMNLLTDRQMRSFPRDFRANLTVEKEKNQYATNEVAIVFMQINTEKDELEAAGDAAVGAGTFAFISTTGVGPLGVLNLKEGTIFGTLAGVGAGTIAYFQTWRSKDIAAAYCGELTSIGSGGTKLSEKETRKGCSIVMPINYKDIQFINRYCSIIEGNP